MRRTDPDPSADEWAIVFRRSCWLGPLSGTVLAVPLVTLSLLMPTVRIQTFGSAVLFVVFALALTLPVRRKWLEARASEDRQ